MPRKWLPRGAEFTAVPSVVPEPVELQLSWVKSGRGGHLCRLLSLGTGMRWVGDVCGRNSPGIAFAREGRLAGWETTGSDTPPAT